MSTNVLSFHCRFAYPGTFRLDASFELPRGISALFGPSGSGKSTCLGLMAGLLRPSHGTIRLNGTALVNAAGRCWVPPHRRRLGMVFQENLLFPHRTVRANLCYGMPPAAADAIRLEDVADILEMGELLDRYPAQLSGGEQRRVALGRALLTQPRLLVMDEPLTGLDDALRDRILQYLQQVHERWEMPMLLVSHDQLAVRRLARYVVILEEGQVAGQGPVSEILDRATIETMVGHPGPVNLLRVEQVRQAGDHSEGRVGNQRFYLPGRATPPTAYVRFLPSDVALLLEDVHRISVRNHLRGVVRDMVRVADKTSGERVYIAVDVGQVLWAQLTPSACEEMALRVGVPVVCLIKAAATHQFS